MYEFVIVYVYLFIAFLLMINDLNIDQNYIALMIFFLVKSIINYRKCTISYLEVKARGVKKKYGYLYTLMDDILNIRYTNHITFIYFICSIILYYFFGVKDGKISIF